MKLRKPSILVVNWVSSCLSFPACLHCCYIYFTALNCTTTIISLEPCALNAEFEHFILSCSNSSWDLMKCLYFSDTTERGDRGWKGTQRQGEDRVTLRITLLYSETLDLSNFTINECIYSFLKSRLLPSILLELWILCTQSLWGLLGMLPLRWVVSARFLGSPTMCISYFVCLPNLKLSHLLLSLSPFVLWNPHMQNLLKNGNNITKNRGEKINSQKWIQIVSKFYGSEHSLVLCLPFTTSCKQCGFKDKYFNAKLRVVLTVSWLAIQYVSILSLIVSFVITWPSWSSVFINIDNKSWCTETFPSSISCKQHKSYLSKVPI